MTANLHYISTVTTFISLHFLSLSPTNYELVKIFITCVLAFCCIFLSDSFFAYSIECYKVVHIIIKKHAVCWHAFVRSLYAYSSKRIHKYPLFSRTVCSVVSFRWEKKIDCNQFMFTGKPFNLKCKCCDLCRCVLFCGLGNK